MNQQKEEEILTEPSPVFNNVAMTILFVWALMGILAFITSLVCFAYNGTFMQNWVGFLTAIVMGPFYWIYYTYSDGYCTSGSRKQQVQSQIRKRVQIIKKKLNKKKRV